MTHSLLGPTTSDERILLRATPGRGWRQLIVLVIAVPIFGAMLALGGAMLNFGWQQGWRSAGFWIAGLFGLLFVCLGVVCLISVIETIGRMIALRPGQPVLQADASGIGDGRSTPTAWADLTSVVVISAPAVFLKGSHPALSRAIGTATRVRDGQRAVRLDRRDCSSRTIHLTLPIGPEEFASSWPVIEALGQRAGVPVEFTDDLSRRFS